VFRKTPSIYIYYICPKERKKNTGIKICRVWAQIVYVRAKGWYSAASLLCGSTWLLLVRVYSSPRHMECWSSGCRVEHSLFLLVHIYLCIFSVLERSGISSSLLRPSAILFLIPTIAVRCNWNELRSPASVLSLSFPLVRERVIRLPLNPLSHRWAAVVGFASHPTIVSLPRHRSLSRDVEYAPVEVAKSEEQVMAVQCVG
jgi:hypothetical protein